MDALELAILIMGVVLVAVVLGECGDRLNKNWRCTEIQTACYEQGNGTGCNEACDSLFGKPR